MSKPVRIPLRAVFYREEGRWVAHCLEFDLMGDGDTQEEALDSLGDAIATQLDASLTYKNLANLFTPAEGKFFQMFAQGQDVAVGEMQVFIRRVSPADGPVVIEDMQAREFSESDPGLVPA